jgi:hypothetical protein
MMQKRWLIALGIFSLGFVLGAVLFSGVQPRAPLTIHRCSVSCLSEKELLGLVGSLVMQNTPSILPNILLETDKTVVIPHPRPASEIHYVAVPKKDIRSASDIHEEDLPYLADAFDQIHHYHQWSWVSGSRVFTFSLASEEAAMIIVQFDCTHLFCDQWLLFQWRSFDVFCK